MAAMEPIAASFTARIVNTLRGTNRANAIVSTIAGLSGQSGQSDGVGSDARFGTPGEIRMAPDDKHLYISEYSNFTIREITIE